MKRKVMIGLMLFLFGTMIAQANDPPTGGESKDGNQAIVKARLLITGLHCKPCTKTVEGSLLKIKGVKSANVDWDTKNAIVEFDEKEMPLQKLLQRIVDTPHMMGGNSKYGAWLALKVDDSNKKDDAWWGKLKQSISKLEGVKQVTLYKAQSSIGVQLEPKGEITSQKLISKMTETGFKFSNP